MPYLEVHVRINRDQVALVFSSPLEFDHYWLSSQIIEERLWVNGNKLFEIRKISLMMSRIFFEL
jgi:hypothetical protein